VQEEKAQLGRFSTCPHLDFLFLPLVSFKNKQKRKGKLSCGKSKSQGIAKEKRSKSLIILLTDFPVITLKNTNSAGNSPNPIELVPSYLSLQICY
jgi:hypothetical protein